MFGGLLNFFVGADVVGCYLACALCSLAVIFVVVVCCLKICILVHYK